MYTLKKVYPESGCQTVDQLGSSVQIHTPGSEKYAGYFDIPKGSPHPDFSAVICTSPDGVGIINWVVPRDCAAYVVNEQGKTVSSVPVTPLS